jgi:hypothetical protein
LDPGELSRSWDHRSDVVRHRADGRSGTGNEVEGMELGNRDDESPDRFIHSLTFLPIFLPCFIIVLIIDPALHFPKDDPVIIRWDSRVIPS